jgi:hypothetical protein
VTDLRNNKNSSRIYRGQSNDYSLPKSKESKISFLTGHFSHNINFKKWPLISSFDRYYEGYLYKFGTFLGQQLQDDNFEYWFGSYKLPGISYLRNSNQLERIYYLQHYGVHTCFMDFSRDPLIALFFSIANVRSTNNYNVDRYYNKFVHPGEAYISCYELNHEKISELFNIPQLDKDFSYEIYRKYKVKNVSAHLAFDLSPIDKCISGTINENLKLQKGCFVLYDNNGSDLPLDRLIDKLFFYENTDKEVVIKEYTLPYNEIFASHNFEEFEGVSLVNYLKRKGISGKDLFNDIQGLKYDLNFFHD